MEDIKKILAYFRNALAFSYSWLVLCTVVLSLAGGSSEVTVMYLLKLLALCVWGSLSFVFAFCTKLMKKRGFIFSLTVFFLMFVPVEVLMFYLMGIFEGAGTPALWITLAVIVATFYISAICIDVFVMRKRAKEFTARLLDYNAQNARK